jgi:hypothetical protein
MYCTPSWSIERKCSRIYWIWPSRVGELEVALLQWDVNIVAEDVLSKHIPHSPFLFLFLSITYAILLFAISIVFTCLKTHGGIDFSLILQAVKCQPPSSAR